MQPDIAQLSEVVVVGYGAEKKEEDEYPLVEMAYPVGGRKAFKEYLMKNLKYPDQALNNEIEGKVTIQFTIETTGRLSEFRVLKGIGYGCEEEVIRLIKEGPKWSATKRNAEPIKDRVKVRMKFALPKKTEPQK
jgi:TonB family protein